MKLRLYTLYNMYGHILCTLRNLIYHITYDFLLRTTKYYYVRDGEMARRTMSDMKVFVYIVKAGDLSIDTVRDVQ